MSHDKWDLWKDGYTSYLYVIGPGYYTSCTYITTDNWDQLPPSTREFFTAYKNLYE